MGGIEGGDGGQRGLGAEGGQAPRPPEADMLAAHDAGTTNARNVQQKLGKLVKTTPTQGRYAAHTASLERSCRRRHAPPDRGTRYVGPKPKPSPKLTIIGVYREQEPRHAFGRDQQTFPVSYLQQSSWVWEGDSWGSRYTWQ